MISQAYAITIGTLAIVQPLLLTGLIFALPVSARLEGRRVGSKEVGWSLAVVVALMSLYFLTRPSPGAGNVAVKSWLIVAGLFVAFGFLGVFTWRRISHRARSIGAGAMCGAMFAVSAALTKVVGLQWHRGVFHLLTMWQLYVLAATVPAPAPTSRAGAVSV